MRPAFVAVCVVLGSSLAAAQPEPPRDGGTPEESVDAGGSSDANVSERARSTEGADDPASTRSEVPSDVSTSSIDASTSATDAQADTDAADVESSDASVPAVTAPAPPASLTEATEPLDRAGTETYDVWASLWGPGRRSAGEVFRSAAEPPPAGSLHGRFGRIHLAVGGQYFARAEVRSNPWLAGGDVDFRVDHRARLGVRVSAYDRVGLVLELQDVRAWGAEVSTTTNLAAVGLHQGYVDLRVTERFDLRVGRQELAYGEDRLIGTLEWAQSGRAFNGVFARVTAHESVTVDGFAMLLAPPRTDEAGGRGRGEYFTGLYARARVGAGGVDLYALGRLRDAPDGARDHRATTGGRAFVEVAGLHAMVEGAYQSGRARSSPGLARTVAAGAFVGRLRYTLRAIFGAPYASVEGIGATGGAPSESRERNFDQLFPTAHIHLGYVDYVAWQNVLAVRGTVGWRPGGAHVWLDVHRFRMWDRHGPWRAANGVTEIVRPNDAREHADMGTELDLSVTIPLFAQVSLAGAFGVFLPGRALDESLDAVRSEPSLWGFLYLRTQV